MQRRFSYTAWAYLLIAPTMIGLVILNIIPFFHSMFLSFTQSQGFGNYSWTGFSNFIRMMQDIKVWKATFNTFAFTIITVPVGVFISLVLAVLLNSNLKGRLLFRIIYFMPLVVAPAAVAMIWRWMFNSDYGIINHFMGMFGISNIQWLTNPSLAIVSISIVAIWSLVGYNMILILAGLQNVPDFYYEAASLDGAGPVRQFFSITIPLVSPTLFFVVTTGVMTAIKQFDFIYMMIDEMNPAIDEVQTLLYLFYHHAFVTNEKGYASAIVFLTFTIIMLLTWLQFKLQKRWVHYE
ncbi:carbohydrate ABC transporter permease [Paenibacillus chungangensis]|uniref:Carbohydrate ABC transporter permease n=1 Tax=Paenibacillus chungangensis TaxID=696535 RepID=A0ABW3HL66_9BACL